MDIQIDATGAENAGAVPLTTDGDGNHLASIGIATLAADTETFIPPATSVPTGIPIIGTRSRACSGASRDRAGSRASGSDLNDSYAFGDDYSQDGFYDEPDDGNFF